MKYISALFKGTILLFVFFPASLYAQVSTSTVSSGHTIQLELKIQGSIQYDDLVKIDDALAGYPGKIISHEYNADKNRLFVAVSKKTDPVDVLQVLKMHGIIAAYRDKDNGYVSLEPGGKTRKLYFKE